VYPCRRRRDAEDFSNLFVGHLLQMSQHDHLLLSLREVLQNTPKRGLVFRGVDFDTCPAVSFRDRQWPPVSLPPKLLATTFVTTIDHDSAYPTPPSTRIAQVSRTLVGGGECVLDGVFGVVLIPEEPISQPHQAIPHRGRDLGR